MRTLFLMSFSVIGITFVFGQASNRSQEGTPFHSTIKDLRPSFGHSVLIVEPGMCAGALKPEVTATIASGKGNGSFVIYCTDSQSIVIEHSTAASLNLKCSNCVQVAVPMPAIPEGMYKIASGDISAGAFTSLTDLRDLTANHRHVNGAGMSSVCAAGTCVDQVDPATVQLRNENYSPVAQFDASKATMSKPFRMGASLVPKCQIGEYFYLTSAAPGARLHECVITNKWAPAMGEGRPKSASTFYPASVLARVRFPEADTDLETDQCDHRPQVASQCSTRSSETFVSTTLPADWKGSIDAKVFVLESTPGTDRATNLEAALVCSSSDLYGSGSFNTPTKGIAGKNGNGRVRTFTYENLDTTNCQPADLITVRVRRLGSENRPQILGVELTLHSN